MSATPTGEWNPWKTRIRKFTLLLGYKKVEWRRKKAFYFGTWPQLPKANACAACDSRFSRQFEPHRKTADSSKRKITRYGGRQTGGRRRVITALADRRGFSTGGTEGKNERPMSRQKSQGRPGSNRGRRSSATKRMRETG